MRLRYNLKYNYFIWLVIIWLVAGLFFPLTVFADCIPENQVTSLPGSTTCADILCCPGLDCEPFVKESNYKSAEVQTSITTHYARCIKSDNSQGSYEEEAKQSYEVKFVPQITIPGSTFTKGQPITITGDTLAQYLADFYKFFISAIAVMAVVMVMWGGFKRLYAAGSPDKIKDANDTIVNAISGLVIALLSYTLLNLVNPKLTEFKTLEIYTVGREEFSLNPEWNPELQLAAQSDPTSSLFNIKTIEPNLAVGNNVIPKLRTEAALNLHKAMEILRSKGYGAVLTEAYRSPEEQKRLIKENCQNPPGSKTCNPKPGKSPTCVMKNGLYSCPHSTGYAVDIWATKNYELCIVPPKNNSLTYFCYSKGKPECLQNECQAALIAAMKKAGFCNLCSEPWHFEYIGGDYKGSPGCTC